MFDFFGAIEAFCGALGHIFEFKQSKTEHQSESEVIKDKKDYKKAVEAAEKIIEIASNYESEMSFAHRIRFSRLCEKFRKYN